MCVLTSVSPFCEESARAQKSQPPGSGFVYVLNEGGTPQPAERIRFPEGLIDAIAKAEVELSLDENVQKGALVFCARAADGREFVALAELHYVGPWHGGYRPQRITDNDGVTFVERHGDATELRIIASGYDTFSRRTIFRANRIVIWDDILLQPLTPATAATIRGTVWLEDEKDLEGIPVSVDGETRDTTDAKGRFTLTGVRSGEIHLDAHKPGYTGTWVNIGVTRGGTANCEIRGYKIRSAEITWVYQSDGTRNLNGNHESGTAIIGPPGMTRIRFDNGFGQVNSNSDFFVEQEKDKLFIRNFDQCGPPGPGFIEIKNNSFDRVTEAPNTGYQSDRRELRPGAVYVFRCYDGKHFAKMEILKVGTAAEIADPVGRD